MTPVTRSLRSLRRSAQRRRGQALFSAVVVGALVLAMTITLANLSAGSVLLAGDMRSGEVLLQAARTGLAQTKLEVWDMAIPVGQTTPGTPNQYRAYLDGKGLVAGSPSPNVDFGTLNGPDGISVTRTGYRYDDGATTYVVLSSVATSPKGRKSSEVVLRVGGTPFDGFRFALLANNVNCIMCHAKFDNVKRRYGTVAQQGTHERVKVAALETLLLRNSPESTIAGTLYVQGELTNMGGALIAVPPQNSGGMLAEDMDAFGRVLDPSVLVNMTNDPNGDGTPDDIPGLNFYKNYPTDATQQFDGPLPSKFPPVVEDTDQNRLISQAEWDAKASTYTGHLSGGGVFAYNPADTYTYTTVPTPGASQTLANNQKKNVILIGTPTDPIDLSGGDVAIDGDVVISGYVKGSGTLLARGNIYILDDVVYADGVDTNGDGAPDGGTVFTGAPGQVRTFGVAPDGSQNTVAYSSTGNIIHGAYNLDKFGRLQDDTIPGVTQGYSSGTPSLTTLDGNGFIVDEESIFNRMEWTKTQPYLDSSGNPSENPSDKVNGNNSAYEGTYDGNGDAVANSYIPRYYTMQAGAASAVRYDPPSAQWNNTNKVWEDSETYDFDVTGNPAAYQTIALPPGQEGVKYVTRPMNPKDNWIPQATLAQLYKNQDTARAAGPYKIDGLLYTDNAVMMLSLPDSRYVGKSDGEAEVNGSIVSADAGILVVNNDGNNLSSLNATGNAPTTTTTYTYNPTGSNNSTIQEGQMGVDINGDGDMSDSITEQQIWNNAQTYANGAPGSWGYRGYVAYTNSPSNRYKVDLKKQGPMGPTSPPYGTTTYTTVTNDVTVTNVLTSGADNTATNFGLRVYYDDRTRNYLKIQDSSKAGIYVVARREH